MEIPITLGFIAFTLIAVLAVNVMRYRNRLYAQFEHARLAQVWRRDPEFVALFESIAGQTDMIVDGGRAYTLYQSATTANRTMADIAEVGVYKGGTAKLLAKRAPNRTVYLFDTFEGMPSATEGIDYHTVGSFDDTTIERVRTLLADCPNTRIVQGIFPGTGEVIADHKFALVHLDVDNYQSNKDAFAFFYPRMIPGGVIVFDDYEWDHTPGIRKSIDEFLADKPERVMRTAEYQAMMIKL